MWTFQRDGKHVVSVGSLVNGNAIHGLGVALGRKNVLKPDSSVLKWPLKLRQGIQPHSPLTEASLLARLSPVFLKQSAQTSWRFPPTYLLKYAYAHEKCTFSYIIVMDFHTKTISKDCLVISN